MAKMVCGRFCILSSLSALSSCVFSLLFLCPLSSLKEKSHFTLCSLMAIFFLYIKRLLLLLSNSELPIDQLFHVKAHHQSVLYPQPQPIPQSWNCKLSVNTRKNFWRQFSQHNGRIKIKSVLHVMTHEGPA